MIMERGVYHIFARGVNRGTVFYDRTENLQFLVYLNRLIKKYGLSLYAFALMNNHFHLLMKGERVQAAVCELVKSYTGWFCHRHTEHGKVFESPAHFVEKQLVKWQVDALLYILNNPVVAGMSKTHYLYEFSSYRFHTKNGSRLKDVISVDTSFVERNIGGLDKLKAALAVKLRYQKLLDGKTDGVL